MACNTWVKKAVTRLLRKTSNLFLFNREPGRIDHGHPQDSNFEDGRTGNSNMAAKPEVLISYNILNTFGDISTSGLDGHFRLSISGTFICGHFIRVYCGRNFAFATIITNRHQLMNEFLYVTSAAR